MLVVSGSGLALTAVTFYQAYQEVDELFDAELARNARLIAMLLDGAEGLDPSVLTRTRAGHDYERYLAFQHWSADGELLVAGGGVPEQPLGAMQSGFSEQTINGRRWHVFALPMSEGGRLLVGEQAHIREELVRKTALTVITPYLLAIPVIVLLVTVALRRGLRPLERLTAAIRRRGDRNLSAVESGVGVRELQPVVEALNHLLHRLQQALEREQRFTADAAHELRTLLAVLKLHSDNARTLTDPQESRHALEQLDAGVGRATRMVNQLLALARLDPEDDGALRTPAFVAPVARQVLAGLDPLARQSRQQLELVEQTPHLRVQLREEALDILLRNLVENALRYSPSGGVVQVLMRRGEDGRVELLVCDDGEGVPPELARRVRDRFFRGTREGNGVGLGLAIVERILELVGGEIQFTPRSAHARACVRVTLPGE